MGIGDAGDAIFAPAICAAAGIVVGEIWNKMSNGQLRRGEGGGHTAPSIAVFAVWLAVSMGGGPVGLAEQKTAATHE